MSQTSFTQDEIESRFVGVSIGLPLHRKLKEVASRERLSMSALLRQSLVERLERSENKRKRKNG